jgi:hypothetical protein
MPPGGAVRASVDCEGGAKVHFSPVGEAGWIIFRKDGDVPSAHRQGKKYREDYFQETPEGLRLTLIVLWLVTYD